MWKPITCKIDRKVLVTNNLNARDALGQMSHVWVVGIVSEADQPEIHGAYVAFIEGWRQVENLTHYAEIPSDLPLDLRDAYAREAAKDALIGDLVAVLEAFNVFRRDGRVWLSIVGMTIIGIIDDEECHREAQRLEHLGDIRSAALSRATPAEKEGV